MSNFDAHCRTRAHCATCRSNSRWRAVFGAPDKCPHGVITGAGDVVEKIAQPIAKAIDRIAGTKISDCGGCSKRRDRLNKRFSKETVDIS